MDFSSPRPDPGSFPKTWRWLKPWVLQRTPSYHPFHTFSLNLCNNLISNDGAKELTLHLNLG